MENNISPQSPQTENPLSQSNQAGDLPNSQPPVERGAVPSGESIAKKVNRYTAFVLIFSGIAFVMIAILAIWEVFGPDAGDVVWRSLGSLGAISLGALIVSVASRLVEQNSHK